MGASVTPHIFPSNYIWSLSVMGAMNSGGAAGEILGLCFSKEMQAAAETSDVKVWGAEWNELAERVERLADSQLAAGHRLSAGETYRRATVYYQLAERMLDLEDERRNKLFVKSQEMFRKYCSLRPQPIDVVKI